MSSLYCSYKYLSIKRYGQRKTRLEEGLPLQLYEGMKVQFRYNRKQKIGFFVFFPVLGLRKNIFPSQHVVSDRTSLVCFTILKCLSMCSTINQIKIYTPEHWGCAKPSPKNKNISVRMKCMYTWFFPIEPLSKDNKPSTAIIHNHQNQIPGML